MRRLFPVIALLAVLLVLCLPAHAEISLPDSITVIEAEAFFGDISLSGHLAIPEGVTHIGDRAFSGCTGLNSVSFPSTLTSIGNGAFSGCTALEGTLIVRGALTVAEDAFAGCAGYSVQQEDDASHFTYVIENGEAKITRYKASTSDPVVVVPALLGGCPVTTIGNFAFRNCPATQIHLPASVRTLEDAAFYSSTMVEITGLENLTSIGSTAFSFCSSLTSIALPEKLDSLGTDVFSYCTSLRNVTLPADLSILSSSTFYECTSLCFTLHTASQIGNGSTYLYEIFPNSPDVTIYAYELCSDGTYKLARFLGTRAEIPAAFNGAAVTGIGDSCFFLSGLTSCTVPSGIQYIEDTAFARTGITSITLPESVTSMGASVFLGCTSLSSVTLPDTLRSIGAYSFYDCSSLTKIVLPEKLESMGTDVFVNCTSLTNVTLPADLSALNSRAFYKCGKLSFTLHTDSQIGDGKLLLYDIFRDSPLVTIYNYKLRSDGTYELVHFLGARADIPASFNGIAVTGIGEKCFYLSGVTSCTIPSSIRHIGKGAFAFTDLTSVKLPEKLDSIDVHAFWLCESLSDVTLPTNLTILPEGTFYGCTALESIVLPDSITELGQFCFENTGLTQINLDNIAFAPVCCFRGSRLLDYAAECIIAEVIKDGMTDFEKTLAVHDWLIYNAEYSDAFPGPEGVMYAGRGLCQSYTDAMLLILGKLDIECLPVVSEEMHHIWNLVKLDGEWYHVDVTWDDPTPNGNEYHLYFGLNDERMAADHTWIASDYPAATGTRYYLGVDNGE